MQEDNDEILDDHKTHLVSFSTLSNHSYNLEYKPVEENDTPDKEGDPLLKQKDNPILWKEEEVVIGDEIGQSMPYNAFDLNQHIDEINDDKLKQEDIADLLGDNKEDANQVVVLKKNLSEFLSLSKTDFLRYQEERWSTLQIENNNIEVLGSGINTHNDAVDNNNHLEFITEGKTWIIKRRRKPFDQSKFRICYFSTEIIDIIENEPLKDNALDNNIEEKRAKGINEDIIENEKEEEQKEQKLDDENKEKEEKCDREEKVNKEIDQKDDINDNEKMIKDDQDKIVNEESIQKEIKNIDDNIKPQEYKDEQVNLINEEFKEKENNNLDNKINQKVHKDKKANILSENIKVKGVFNYDDRDHQEQNKEKDIKINEEFQDKEIMDITNVINQKEHKAEDVEEDKDKAADNQKRNDGFNLVEHKEEINNTEEENKEEANNIIIQSHNKEEENQQKISEDTNDAKNNNIQDKEIDCQLNNNTLKDIISNVGDNQFIFQEETNVIPDQMNNEVINENNKQIIINKGQESKRILQETYDDNIKENNNNEYNSNESIIQKDIVPNDYFDNLEVNKQSFEGAIVFKKDEETTIKHIKTNEDNALDKLEDEKIDIEKINKEESNNYNNHPLNDLNISQSNINDKEGKQQKDNDNDDKEDVNDRIRIFNQLKEEANDVKDNKTNEIKLSNQTPIANEKEEVKDIEIIKKDIERLAQIEFEKIKKEELERLIQNEINKRVKEKEKESIIVSQPESSLSKEQEQDNRKQIDEKETNNKPESQIPIAPPLIDLTNLYRLAKKNQQQSYRIIKHPAIEVIDNPLNGNNKKMLSNSLSDVKKNNRSLSKDSNSAELTKLKENLSKNVDSKKQKKRGRCRRTLDDRQIQLQQQQQAQEQEANIAKETPKKLSIELSKVESEETNLDNRTITIEKLPKINTNDLLSTHTEISKESNEETEDFRNRTFEQNKKYEFHPNYSKDSSLSSNEDDNKAKNIFCLNSQYQNKRKTLYNNNKFNPYRKNPLSKYQSKDNSSNNNKTKEKAIISNDKCHKKHNSKNQNIKSDNANKQSKLKINNEDKYKLNTMKNKQRSNPHSGVVVSKKKKFNQINTIYSKNETLNNNNSNSTKHNNNSTNHLIQMRNGNTNQLNPINNHYSNINLNNNKLSSNDINQEGKPNSIYNKPLSSVPHKLTNNDALMTNPLIQYNSKTTQDFRTTSKPTPFFPVPSACTCQHFHNPPYITAKDLNSGYEYWLENRKRKTFSTAGSRCGSVRNIPYVDNTNANININNINSTNSKKTPNIYYKPTKIQRSQKRTFSNLTNEEIERKKKQILEVLQDPTNPYSTNWQEKMICNRFHMGLTSNGTINSVPVLNIVKKKEEPTEDKFIKIQQELLRQKSLETSKYYNKSSVNFHPCSKEHNNNGVDYKKLKLENYDHIEYPAIIKYFN